MHFPDFLRFLYKVQRHQENMPEPDLAENSAFLLAQLQFYQADPVHDMPGHLRVEFLEAQKEYEYSCIESFVDFVYFMLSSNPVSTRTTASLIIDLLNLRAKVEDKRRKKKSLQIMLYDWKIR